ncbi:MAG: signal peptidase I [Acidaminobacteraceae bacterium]
MKKEAYEWLRTIVLSIIIAVVLTSIIRPTIVKGESMMPTLQENNYLIIDKASYHFNEPLKGDIVVFSTDFMNLDGSKKDLIKRVIGVSGDNVVIKEGLVYINGKEIKESYILDDFTKGEFDVIIPKGSIFVLGDNRDNSLDSRNSNLGLVNLGKVKGKVLIRLFPFNEIGSVD